MLFPGKPGALDKIQDGNRGVAVPPACPARGLEVLAPHVGIFVEVALRKTLHEGVVERPPRRTQQGDPEELLLQKKLEERNMSVEGDQQHKDIGPRLVVAVHEIPLFRAQPFEPVDIIGGVLGDLQRSEDPPYPAVHRAHQCPCAGALPGLLWEQDLGDGKDMHRYGKDDGIDNHERYGCYSPQTWWKT